MYGHPEKGVMPDYKPEEVKKESSDGCECLHPFDCNGICSGNWSPSVEAIMNRVYCVGCE